MTERRSPDRNADWRLPVAAVMAAAIATLVMGLAKPKSQFQAEYAITLPVEDEPIAAAVYRDLLASGELAIEAREQRSVEWGHAIHVRYAGDDHRGLRATHTCALQIAERLHPQPLTADERDERLYEIDTYLADIAHQSRGSDGDSDSLSNSRRRALLAERAALLADSSDDQPAAPRVLLVNESRRLANGLRTAAPVVLLILLLAAVHRLLAPPEKPRDSSVELAARLSLPVRTVTLPEQRAA